MTKPPFQARAERNKRVPPALSGFSLIELLLVLGAISILLVAAFFVYPQVRDSSVSGRTVTNTVAVAANVNALYGSSSYGSLNNSTAINAKLVPASMVTEQGSSSLASEWGGAVSLSAAGTKNRGWRIVYEDVPDSICNQLTGGLSSHFTAVAINNQIIKDSGTPIADPGAIALACDEDSVLALGMGAVTGAELLASVGGGGPDMGINPPEDGDGPTAPIDGPEPDRPPFTTPGVPWDGGPDMGTNPPPGGGIIGPSNPNPPGGP